MKRSLRISGISAGPSISNPLNGSVLGNGLQSLLVDTCPPSVRRWKASIRITNWEGTVAARLPTLAPGPGPPRTRRRSRSRRTNGFLRVPAGPFFLHRCVAGVRGAVVTQGAILQSLWCLGEPFALTLGVVAKSPRRNARGGAGATMREQANAEPLTATTTACGWSAVDSSRGVG